MISVCLATYNGESHLAEQLDSVLAQLSRDDELIVADDGSTDASLAIVNDRHDARIRVLDVPGHLGPAANFERALRAARGDIIFLCDQDDVWLPNKRAVFLDALRSADLVVSDCRVTDATLAVTLDSFFAHRGSGPGLIRNLWRNGFLGCCMAFRRGIIDQALPFPANIPMHDSWIGLVAQTCGTVHFVREPTLLYRRHGANFSPTGEHSPFSIAEQIGHRLALVGGLARRWLAIRLGLHRSTRPGDAS